MVISCAYRPNRRGSDLAPIQAGGGASRSWLVGQFERPALKVFRIVVSHPATAARRRAHALDAHFSANLASMFPRLAVLRSFSLRATPPDGRSRTQHQQ